MHHEENDPLLDPDDRLGFGLWCLGLFSFAVYGAFHWPPHINAQGATALVLKVLCLEFILLMIPFGFLGVIWAIAMPNWTRYWLNLLFKHLTIVIVLCVIMLVVAMAFIATGIWK